MISLMLLIPVILQASEIEISQPLNIKLIGGDSKTINLTVTYTGDNKATCTMSSSILPDGEGINITYIPSHFTLNHNGAQNVTMIINTSFALMPNIYTITTQVSAVSSKGSSGGKIDIITESEDNEDDDTSDDTGGSDDTGDDETQDDIIDGIIIETKFPWQDYAISIIVVICAIVVLTLLYIFRRRKDENEN